jgi:hypothetical protein
METATIVILLVLVALAIIAFLVFRAVQARKKREHLQNRFGPEYDRAVDEHGGRRPAEQRLADVAERRDQLEIRELDEAERRRHAEDWTSVQAAFVDAPAAATRDADRLVGRVMRARGYPVDDFETKADMVAIDHPDVVENYRAAHRIGSREEHDGSSTEELRTAFVHYRMLFEELLGDPARSRDAERPETETLDLRGRDRTRQSPDL